MCSCPWTGKQVDQLNRMSLVDSSDVAAISLDEKRGTIVKKKDVAAMG